VQRDSAHILFGEDTINEKRMSIKIFRILKITFLIEKC